MNVHRASRTPHTPRPVLFVDNLDSTDASRNLALEEYVLRHRMGEDDLLLFYVNAPAIIIGRNQNTIEEIAADVVAERGIRVVRRVSGGGAVYHDRGNLNFSFMTRDVSGRFNRYDRFNGPVVDVLRGLGVPAEIGGRNDILVEGRKISGTRSSRHPTGCSAMARCSSTPTLTTSLLRCAHARGRWNPRG